MLSTGARPEGPGTCARGPAAPEGGRRPYTWAGPEGPRPCVRTGPAGRSPAGPVYMPAGPEGPSGHVHSASGRVYTRPLAEFSTQVSGAKPRSLVCTGRRAGEAGPAPTCAARRSRAAHAQRYRAGRAHIVDPGRAQRDRGRVSSQIIKKSLPPRARARKGIAENGGIVGRGIAPHLRGPRSGPLK